MPRPRTVTLPVAERRIEVRRGIEAGESRRKIALRLDISRPTVDEDIRWLLESRQITADLAAPRQVRKAEERAAAAAEPVGVASTKLRQPSVGGLVPDWNREVRPEEMPEGWDGATAYARGVVDGEIVAGLPIRNEAARHLADLGDPRWRWEPARVWALLRFMERCSPKDYAVPPFVEFVFGRFIGLLHADGEQAGFRRFQQVFLVSGRKSGKTLAATMLLWWGVLMDGEEWPECYVVARDEKQAGTAFRDVVASYQRGYIGNLEPTASAWIVIGGLSHARRVQNRDPAGGFLELRSGQAKAMIGARPHFGLLDEFAQHIDDSMQEAVDQGFGNRRQPAMLVVTNAGESLETPAGAAYLTAKAVAAGEVEMETLLPAVFEVDEEDDPLDEKTGEACWEKAEPALSLGFPSVAFVRKEVEKARANPAKANSVLRMLFGRWVSSDEAWLPPQRWIDRETDDWPDGWERWRCYGGLDLSASTDLTALALVWVEPGDAFRLWAEVHVWSPARTLEARARSDRAPYLEWVRAGHLTATPGSEMIDLEWVAARLAEVAERYRIEGVAYDRYRMPALRQVMTTMGIQHGIFRREKGIWLVEHPQNFVVGSGPLTKQDKRRGGVRLFMPRSIDETERAVRDGRLHIRPSPPLRMALSGVRIVHDPQLNRRFEKQGSRSRTDAAVALTMAVGLAHDDRVNRRGGEISAAQMDEMRRFYETGE